MGEKCAEHDLLMGTLQEIKSDTAKIPALDKKIDVHLAEHAGIEKAQRNALNKSGVAAAQWKVWVAIAAVAITMGASVWALARSLGA